MKLRIKICEECSRTFAPKSNNQKYCKRRDCIPKGEDTSSEKESINCICPMCGCTHTKIIYWTGRFTPKIRCEYCNVKIKSFYDGEEIDQETQDLLTLLKL